MIEEKKKPQVEILSPAGSYESFLAAIHAGADAVYAGGPRFGARAFADNFTEETLKQAIDYAHFHGGKVYLKTGRSRHFMTIWNPCICMA